MQGLECVGGDDAITTTALPLSIYSSQSSLSLSVSVSLSDSPYSMQNAFVGGVGKEKTEGLTSSQGFQTLILNW